MKSPIRCLLPFSNDFKKFWKSKGPYRYALTSSEFPPTLLEPEEWIFADNAVDILKSLMQWEERGMAIVPAPFNRRKKRVFKPDILAPWKIENFPDEWKNSICKTFTPVGHLTVHVMDIAASRPRGGDSAAWGSHTDHYNLVDMDYVYNDIDAGSVEKAFFASLEAEIDSIGYTMLKSDQFKGEESKGDESCAFIKEYLEEWELDEQEG
ncbi:MAG: hypothetical protein HQK66_10185 [Desulfamplus sp.]|nr:hypothetical protein [Desulfamplus sp.]